MVLMYPVEVAFRRWWGHNYHYAPEGSILDSIASIFFFFFFC